MDIKASIIICTYNRAELLNTCLESLSGQSVAGEGYEIIVINNNSTDDTLKVASGFHDKFKNYRVINEEKSGLSNARNRGLQEAAAQWVLYLDDDIKAEEDLIERFIYDVENYNFDCIGGVFLPWYQCERPKWFPEDQESNKHLANEGISVLQRGYATGCVIGFRKSVLLNIGGFTENIGMNGKKVGYGEETAVQIKIRKQGGQVALDSKLVIYHLVDVYKQTPLWFIKKGYAVGRDYWLMHEKVPTILDMAKLPLRGLINFVTALIKSSIKMAWKNYYYQNWLIDVFRPQAVMIGASVGIYNCLARK